MCNKIKFDSESHAMGYMAQWEATRNDSDKAIPTRAYLCPTCFAWHITRLKHGSSLGLDIRTESPSDMISRKQYYELNNKYSALLNDIKNGRIEGFVSLKKHQDLNKRYTIALASIAKIEANKRYNLMDTHFHTNYFWYNE